MLAYFDNSATTRQLDSVTETMVEMMKECRYSCAVANAHPDLKAHCNYQLALSNDEYGVIKVLNKLLEKPEDQFSGEWFAV